MPSIPWTADSNRGPLSPETCWSPRIVLIVSVVRIHALRAPSDQGIIVVVCPGSVMVITPAHMHVHIEMLLSATLLEMPTGIDPGVQGDDVAGMHGCGVSTPIAAAVAAATCGLAGLMHMPNG